MKKIFVLFLFVIFNMRVWSQFLTVISPNGNEEWKINSTQIIKWESESIKEVKLEYSLDGGLSWKIIVQLTDASLGEYSWLTADAQTPYVLIKISDASNPFIYDISNENFSIVKETSQENIEKIEFSSIKIMPLGDSITWGTNPDDPNSPGYRRTLDSLLTNEGCNFEFVGSLIGGEPNDFDRNNEGHPGWQAFNSVLPNKSLLDSIKNFLTNNPPDIILLHIGTNDLRYDSPSTLAGEVKNLLDTIFTFNPEITVVIAKIIDRGDTEIRHNRTVDFNNTELPDMIISLPSLQQEKIVLVNMYDSLGVYWNNFTNPNFTYQVGVNLYTLHPNTTGYKVMANVWYNALINILRPLSQEVEVEIFPNKFELYQNYPNPFNPNTTIIFSIPHSSLVTLKVCDLIGKEVSILINEEKQVGNYEIKFNADNLSSGVYLCRLQSGNFVQTRKMLLLK